MATVASNVLALYVFTLRGEFPTIAGHLVSASILSAPAALMMSKVLLPERQKPKTLGEAIRPHYQKESNIFEAVIGGANQGVKVVVGVAALLIAALGMVALIDLFLQWVGGFINQGLDISVDFSLKGLLGYCFYPLVLALGIPPADANLAAGIIGERLVLTEVASYKDLAAALANGAFEHPRTPFITAYALCGFAHVASMAIFVGGVSALAPKRTRTLSEVGFRALLAATFACLLTACVAGTFYSPGSVLLGQ
jgi:CNT family concentrative nucleoside transporter